MVEFKLIKDSVEYVPVSQEELEAYEQRLLDFGLNYDMRVYGLCAPSPTPVFHSVVEEMAGMVEEGWQIHTFSVDSKGIYFALMERERND